MSSIHIEWGNAAFHGNVLKVLWSWISLNSWVTVVILFSCLRIVGVNAAQNGACFLTRASKDRTVLQASYSGEPGGRNAFIPPR